MLSPMNCVEQLQIWLQDVAFLPFQASVFVIFLNNYSGDNALAFHDMYQNLWFGDKIEHAPCPKHVVGG